MAELPTGTVTFLFTDIESSTARWEHQPEVMRLALARHDALIRAAILEHAGHVVKTMGDAFHAAFARAPDALASALDAQRRLQAEAWGEIGSLHVRMALHTGAAEERDGDYYGPELNRAARLLATGHGGQVLLSEATTALVRDALPDGIRLLDLGRHRLKDLTEPERVSQVVAPGLSSDFPPLASLDARPHNLPTHPTALLGRDREVAEVSALLRDEARLVTLTGPGGTGKTRLSLQVAAELLDGFEHGAFLVELAPISDPALVPSAIAQVLGVRDPGTRPIVETLREYLRGRSLLLLLDNFEQILPAASVVADLLAACPGLAVLATSREPLRLRGEHEYAVLPLALPDSRQATTPDIVSRSPAVALFVQRARAVRADFALADENATAVVEICARVDGLPLAIELAAARIKLLPPLALLNRLERRLPVLTGGARDLPARQRTLRDTIDWSHNLLDRAERWLLRRLAVFVGGCTLEAAEAVCDAEGDLGADVLDAMASLVDKSLLRQVEGPGGEPRFTMLETVREYGLEQLQAAGEEAAIRRRHLAWFAALSERGEPGIHTADGGLWLDRLEADLDNFRVALTWSLADADFASRAAGMRTAGAGLHQFWLMRAYLTEGRRWCEQVLAADHAPGPASPSAGRIWPAVRTGAFGAHPRVGLLVKLALMYEHVGDVQRATPLAEEALALARKVHDRAGEAHALMEIGTILRSTGEHARAAPSYEAGLAIAREVGEPHGIWRGTNMLGQNRLNTGDLEGARVLFEESLRVGRAMGYAWGVASILRNLGVLAYRQGDLDRAIAFIEEGLAGHTQLGTPHGAHDLLMALGHVVLARGDPGRASTCFAEGLALCVQASDRLGITRCLEGLAGVAAATPDESDGSPVRAARLLGKAAEVRASLGVPTTLVERATVERATERARAVLGENAFAAAWAEGRAMTPEQAVAYALGEPAPP